MAYSQFKHPLPDYSGIDFSTLSAFRTRAIKEIIPMVVPSMVGDAKFSLFQSKEKVEQRLKENPNFTTCGALPAWYFEKLGLHKSLSSYGLSSVRDDAIRLGCWRANDHFHAMLYEQTYGVKRRPLPGDVYILSGKESEKEITHIGIIINSSGNRWWTADAGQGEKTLQQAWYVPRSYKEDTRQLDGETYSNDPKRPMRRIIGWVDIERALEVS